MKAKHTPGPWAVWPHLDSYHIRGQGKDIAFTRPATETHMGKEEQANARLIAAAPDLLESLHIIASQSLGDDWTAAAAFEFVKRHAQSAIAKAKGGTR